jgi:hypothetical protein
MILEGFLTKVKLDRTTRIVTAQVRQHTYTDGQFWQITLAANPGDMEGDWRGRRIRFMPSRTSPGVAILIELLD